MDRIQSETDVQYCGHKGHVATFKYTDQHQVWLSQY